MPGFAPDGPPQPERMEGNMATHTEHHPESQPQESTLSTVLWTGGALFVVVLIAIYAAM